MEGFPSRHLSSMATVAPLVLVVTGATPEDCQLLQECSFPLSTSDPFSYYLFIIIIIFYCLKVSDLVPGESTSLGKIQGRKYIIILEKSQLTSLL